MDANIITTIVTGLGVLGGVMALINRSEDRVTRNLTSHMDIGFTAVNTRFDDMRELWRAELRRVEDVLDARLKHLEEK